MTSFADIPRDELRTDCRYYTGYRPCHKHDGCGDCTEYAPRGTQVLIIKLGAMGDVLRTKALLPALRRKHPHSWFVWITNPGSESIVRDPLVDEVRTLDAAGLLTVEGRAYDAVYCFDKDLHALELSRRVTAQQRFGFAPTPHGTVDVWNEASMYALRLGLSDELKYRRNALTAPAIVAQMAEVDYAGEGYGLSLSEDARARAAAIRAHLGIPASTRLIGLNTGCGPVFATKGWPTPRMKEFLDLVSRDESVTLLLLGGRREEPIHRALNDHASRNGMENMRDAGTHNDLETFFALVGECDLLLSADSLAMHVGIALGVPMIAWFGPTCEQEIDLFGRGEKLVTDFPCSPCYFKHCPKDEFCLDALSAETVMAAAKRQLVIHAGAVRT